jgi:hypothetical protein
MNEWQEDFTELLETVTNQVEGFFFDVAQDVTEVVNTFVSISEEISTQLQTIFADEMEQYVSEIVSPVLEAYFGLGGAVEEVTQPMIQNVEPFLKHHAICSGCRHFHGQVYGGTMLVCGMHPYGIEDGSASCPDKDLASWKSSPFDSFFGSEDDRW